MTGFRFEVAPLMKAFLLSAVVLGGIHLPVRAEQSVDLRDAWIRYLPGDRPMAGYFELRNNGDVDRELMGAASETFAGVHLHQSVEQDGTTTMQPVSSVSIPAGGRVAFEPSGYHLMLMQRRKDLEVGDRVAITLIFDNGGEQSTEFTIKPVWQE